MWFRTLFDSLKPGRSGTPVQQARRGPPRRRPAACRLAVEPLEDRCVPASASLTVTDATIIEGHAGTQNAVVLVSLSSPSTKTVTVNYSTANGTGLAGSDYQAVSGTLTFAPGQTSKSILVPVTGDRLGEFDETFFINLSGAQNATIADGQGVVVILDDEPRISMDSNGSLAGWEGNSGMTLFTFTVRLSATYDQAVTVNYATQDGTAIAGRDYVAAAGTLTFAPGETTKTITVEVIGNTIPEPDKEFCVNLSGASSNALDVTFGGIGTIVDDDGWTPPPNPEDEPPPMPHGP